MSTDWQAKADAQSAIVIEHLPAFLAGDVEQAKAASAVIMQTIVDPPHYFGLANMWVAAAAIYAEELLEPDTDGIYTLEQDGVANPDDDANLNAVRAVVAKLNGDDPWPFIEAMEAHSKEHSARFMASLAAMTRDFYRLSVEVTS